MVHSEKFLIFFNDSVYHLYQVISELWGSRMRHEKGEHSPSRPVVHVPLHYLWTLKKKYDEYNKAWKIIFNF